MEIIRDDDYVWLNLISDFIEDFVAPASRARLYYLLSKPNRRDEVIHGLCEDAHLDPRYLHPISKDEQGASEIYAALRKADAPTHCFALGVWDESKKGWLKTAIDLEDALKTHVGFCGGIILYCPKEKLGYWEEHHGYRHILSRAPQVASPSKRG